MPPASADSGRLPKQAYILKIRQQPLKGKVLGKDKDRKPVDPPPVVQLFIRDPEDPAQNYLQSPYYFACCQLWHATEDGPPDGNQCALSGSLVSSLHRLKDVDSQGQSRDGGFFVFGDLSAKVEGKYRLKFAVFEQLQGMVQLVTEGFSDAFTIYNAKNFPGMAESTFMSRSFGDQGVRLRIRKESRQLLKRPASSGYSPPAQPPPSLPTSMAPSHGQGAQYGATAHGTQGYVQSPHKSFDGDFPDSASKRQRSTGASPTSVYDRQPTHPSMPSYGYPGSEAGMQQPYPSSRSFQGYDGQAGYDAQARYNPSLMRGQYDGASAGGAPIPFHFRGADGTGYQPMTGAGYPNPMGAGINNFTFAQHASEGAARDGATPASMGNMLPPLSSTATDPSVKSEINPYGAANQAGYGQGGPHQGQNQDSSSRYGGAGSFNNQFNSMHYQQ